MPITNADFYNTITRMALEVGVLPPTDRGTFNDNNLLPSPLVKLKLYTDKCQRMLIRTLNKKFTQRLFTLTTLAAQSTYDVDPLTNLEGVMYHSVRCNTTGSVGPLHNLAYNLYRETWQDTSLIPQGKPQQWVAAITPSSAGVERDNKLIILPTPDAAYEIEYASKINMQPLVNDDDIIMFPPEYEDVLWTWGEAMLESKLGVDATMGDYAQMAIDSCRMWGERPIDEKRGVRMGVQIKTSGNLSGSYYDNQNFTEGWGV